MRFFCPKCWKDFPQDFVVCPDCGVKIPDFWRAKTYEERLIAALRHPEHETAERAAWILGELGVEGAVDDLLRVVEAAGDVYVARAAVEALAKIGTPRAADFLVAAARGHRVAMVRDMAKGALMRKNKSTANEAAEDRPWLSLPLREGASGRFRDLVLDFNGTLAADGTLLPGISDRLRELAKIIRVRVLTADTFGKAADQLRNLPVEITLVKTGAAKADFLRRLGPEHVLAIGNGRNDVAMMSIAALSVAVIGPEGASGELLRVADVVVTDIHQAFDLIVFPLRLRAVLRD